MEGLTTFYAYFAELQIKGKESESDGASGCQENSLRGQNHPTLVDPKKLALRYLF